MQLWSLIFLLCCTFGQTPDVKEIKLIPIFSTRTHHTAEAGGDVYYARMNICPTLAERIKGKILTIIVNNPHNPTWAQCPTAWQGTNINNTTSVSGPFAEGGVGGYDVASTSTFDKDLYSSYTKECRFPPQKGCDCTHGIMQIPIDWPSNQLFFRFRGFFSSTRFTASVQFLDDMIPDMEPKDGNGALFQTQHVCGADNCPYMVTAVAGSACQDNGKPTPCQVETDETVVFYVPMCTQNTENWDAVFQVVAATPGSAFEVELCSIHTPASQCQAIPIGPRPAINVDWLSLVTVKASGNGEGFGVAVTGKGGNPIIGTTNSFNIDGEQASPTSVSSRSADLKRRLQQNN